MFRSCSVRAVLIVPALLVLPAASVTAGARVDSSPGGTSAAFAASPETSASSSTNASFRPTSSTDPCTLAGALERVRTSSRAEAIAGEVAAAAALETQAAARPNPRLGLEVEDVTGSGSYANVGQSQTTLALSQPIELGGRRTSRMALAARESAAEQVRALRDRVRAEVVTKQALVALMAAREELAIRRRSAELSREISAHARVRTEQGVGSMAEAEQASITASGESVAASEAERTVVVAEHRLVSLWGGRPSEAACFTESLVLPAEAELAREPDRLDGNPAVALAEADVDVRRAEVETARADVSPELSVAAGLRYRAGSDDVTVVSGLQVELPLFDRNTGNVQAAEHGLFASQARARLARQDAGFDVVRVRQSVLAAHRRARILAEEAIPSAERVLNIQRRAWRTGAASYLDLAVAGRSLLALRLDRLDALIEYHVGRATLEGLSGAVSPAWTGSPNDPARQTESQTSTFSRTTP